MGVIPAALQGLRTGQGEDCAPGADSDSTAGRSRALRDGATRLPPGRLICIKCHSQVRKTQAGDVSMHKSPPRSQLRHPAPAQQSLEGTYRSPNIMGSLRHWVQASWNHCRQR